jgi:RNA polymerase sigma-70 factor (ECF subfamily)
MAHGHRLSPPRCQNATLGVSNASMPGFAATLHAIDRLAPPPPAIAATTDALLLQHEPQVRRLVHRLLGWSFRGHDVEDVVQEVMLAAWRRRDSFRGNAALSTWLTTIAVRKAQNHARWAAVRRRTFGWLVDAHEVTAPVPPCSSERGDELLAVRAAMARLRHRDREVLVLHYLEARSIDEVRALLSLSRAAADGRLSRARKRLRGLLGLGDGLGERPEDA